MIAAMGAIAAMGPPPEPTERVIVLRDPMVEPLVLPAWSRLKPRGYTPKSKWYHQPRAAKKKARKAAANSQRRNR